MRNLLANIPFVHSFKRLGGVLVLALLALAVIQSDASAQTSARCYALFGPQYYYMTDTTFESCARYAQAAKGYGDQFGLGWWHNYQLAIDANGKVYYRANGEGQWQYAGVLRNRDGSTGSLADRCFAGDTQACAAWQAGSQRGIDGLNRLYPKGWSH
jgi:hypothetical protein